MRCIKPYYSYKKDAYQELVLSFTPYLEKVSPLYNLVKSMNKSLILCLVYLQSIKMILSLEFWKLV